MAPNDKMLDQIFNLKFTAKQLTRQAAKCEKEEKAEKAKAAKAIEKENLEGARIYAQNAIRKKTEQLNYLKLGSRLDAVVSRLETQAKMNAINRNMAGIVKSLEKSLNTHNLEQVSNTMDQFEKQFENLDLQASAVEESMSATMTLTTPEDKVNELLMQISDEKSLNLKLDMPTASTASPAPAVAAAAPAQGEAPQPVAVGADMDLSARLAALKARG